MKHAVEPLDNPIWHALTHAQKNLSEGDDRARRFQYEIGPLAGLACQAEEAYASLATLDRPDELLVLFLNEPPVVPEGWTLAVGGQLTQMVCDAPLSPPNNAPNIELLTEADIPAMLELTRLTKPGPFRPQTSRLGRYVGIRQNGRLAAMAGERLQVNGYTEVSAVCTHPDFQGQGYARALVTDVAAHIRQQGHIPFLHTGMDNQGAIRVYERLGFRQRRLIHLAVLRCSVAVGLR
ncbi:MAG: putative acyltransferase [Vampirovibrio sp.]|jgi:ribosomal protein S18 acetylase RimI-like enzyme|nr:putative acyltransferase [Vampirovibrio sp.]